MNFGEGFSTPNEEFRWGNSWIPATPQKPIPIKPHANPFNPHGNCLQGASWQDQLTGIPSEHVQMGPRYNGMAQTYSPIEQLYTNGGLHGYDGSLRENNQMINHIAGSHNPGSFTQLLSSDGSFTQLLGNDSPSWTNRSMSQVLHEKAAYVASRTRNVSRSVDMAVNTHLIPKMHHPQVANQGNSSGSFFVTNQNCNNSSYPSSSVMNRHLVMDFPSEVDNSQRNSNAFAWLFSNQTHCPSSNLLSNGDSSSQISPYDIPIQVTSYDLNSSPTEAEAASSVASLLQFTRDQPENFENQLSSVVNPLTDESSSREKDKQVKLGMPVGDETIQTHGDELLQNIVESSSAAISTPYKENKDSDRESDRGIDLNKTPQQKTPKRRKHRPKVIKESKPRRAPKSATPKNTESMENRPVKRKYVRKNVPKESPSQIPDGTRETTDPNDGKVAKSCRRVLHFDSEKTMEENQFKVRGQQEEMQPGNNNIIDLTSDSEETHVSTGTDQVYKKKPAQGTGLHNRLMEESKIPGSMSNSTPSRIHMPNNYTFLPERRASAAHLATTHMNIQNLHVVSGQVENRHSDLCQRRWSDGYIPMQQHNHEHSHAEGIGEDATRAKTSAADLLKAKENINQNGSESVPKVLSRPSEGRGSKREHCQSIEQTDLSTNHPPSSLLCQEILQFDDHEKNSCTLGKEFSESHKKQKFEKGYSSIYEIRQIEECLGKVERRGQHCVNSNGVASELNHTILGPYIESNIMAERQNKGIHKFTSDKHTQSLTPVHNFLNQQISSKSHSCQEFSVMSFSTLSSIEAFNQLPSSPPRKSFQPGNRQVLQNLHDNMSAKKQTALTKRKKRGAEPPISQSVSSGTDAFQQGQDASYDYEQFPSKAIGFPIARDSTYIDYIIDRFTALNLNGCCSQFLEHEQNALVPYRGDGTVIPYEGVVKKKKPRPKVELDPETNRVWNLLMGKEGSEGMDGTGKKKEKYWEEERKVFQGRVESFIARMHLVQGDRRFSRWKGSVVDSVVGVFLTQNVSDHLSSSAFMCLAARFPPKVSNRQAEEVGTSILVTEPEVCMRSPDDASKWHEQISLTLHESAENQRDSETSGIGRNLVEARSQCLEEEFVSSQDSFESSVTQIAVGIRPYPICNPEADHTTRCQTQNIDISIEANQKMEKATMFQDFYREVSGSSLLNDGSKNCYIECEQLKPRSDGINHLGGTYSFTDLINLHDEEIQVPIATSSNNHLHMYPDPGEPEPWRLGTFSEESISSWPSTASRHDIEKERKFKSLSDDEPSGSVVNPSVEQNILLGSQEKPTKDRYASFRQHSTDQPNSSSGCNQPSYCSRQCEENQTVQLGNTPVRESVKHTEPLPRKKSDNKQHVPNASGLKKGSFNVDNISVVNKHMHKENQSVDSNLREELYSYGQSHKETSANVSKGRKAKTESEKKNAVDWDILRKQAQANGRKKERNKDAMDSLDYEALINANVKEISNAIRERGMNNMLAERIQEFLNRLVREHGSIDLEWLRDVPPDKAKDYLLSIRGLGLKSVECVRLLTLHHLAFPVDTNVGRIAVRLGWVPLQPLPESLQLHLLELYPMLESIQKYLWPRLCKLDQLTLYELHYQMITFGKVFCTKSKPNCNACPMRGECRHFASAFASARLALPGPEEKSLVSSSVPIAAEMNPTINVTPMSLPPLENNSLQKAGTQINKCEPIIEEPVTPEQHFTELSEADIEDFDDDDYEDIPTIKLNIEKFTETLQNYMEENMELQEGDMSKALVALSQEAASLPTPKLKNVSRLRTEHQVYELPDSHPLLEGMDRREPDDPSPYLLAIWTPGETADSTQPPESRCGAQNQNKLCNENTCFSCNSVREETSQTVRGTILIPCRTAMKGSFPLNGTYFQVNEMFADHASSLNPINVPRGWIWNLPRRTVYFGTSVSTIFKGLPTEGIQYCFWRGYVCVRAFDRETRAPRPLKPRLHYPLSKLTKNKNEENT